MIHPAVEEPRQDRRRKGRTQTGPGKEDEPEDQPALLEGEGDTDDPYEQGCRLAVSGQIQLALFAIEDLLEKVSDNRR